MKLNFTEPVSKRSEPIITTMQESKEPLVSSLSTLMHQNNQPHTDMLLSIAPSVTDSEWRRRSTCRSACEIKCAALKAKPPHLRRPKKHQEAPASHTPKLSSPQPQPQEKTDGLYTT